ncbi:MAG TPA: M1 family metallopeptidase [Chitinophagales bacterium]|nr:M1 family metallopeptidase [Chitinophagales bacterium]
MKGTIPAFLLSLAHFTVFSQLLVDDEKAPTRADTLRGMLSPARVCYDVTYYDLTVKVIPDSQSIEGTTTMMFKAVDNFEIMQIDLFENMTISSILLNETPVHYRREYNAVFVHTGTVKKESSGILQVNYSGKPQIARKPPWDGGFVWEKDLEGHPWIAVACEGTGASLWWPNKDHLSDEPDSMKIHIIVPDTLVAVSNGRLTGERSAANGWKQYDWRVSYPINNYNVTLNIGKYVHFTDRYRDNDDDLLPLSYYVLPYNLERAKQHFEQVKPMMKCYERYFGKYPFSRDGYKLVETPYLGMEHQSAIAYGNGYAKGYAGMDYSGIGLDFDYIIVHETGHEWWGNAVSCSDIADLWIHEGFCTYSEALYVECLYGKETALAYVNAKKAYVENIEPVIGIYNINREGSPDMYNKGMLMLNTLRHVINNDSLWFSIIRGIIREFSYKTTTSRQIEDYISRNARMDLSYFFDQYLRHSKIPVFEYRLGKKNKWLEYRWSADVPDFKMPMDVTLTTGYAGKTVFGRIYPTATWQKISLNLGKAKNAFKAAEDLFYVEVKKL